MALDFPSSPTNNQVYENYIYSATSGAWQKLPGNTFATTAISDTPPVSPANGDLWWNSADGKFYIYYSDGSSAQWVSAALPAVAVSDTPPAGYDGQMWLDSTDGSMYVYYTDPGGASSSWIGAVSRSGGILQVVQTVKVDVASTASSTYSDIPGLSATITPRSTSSKIMIMAQISHSHTAANTDSQFNLLRNSTNLLQSTGGTTRNATYSPATHPTSIFMPAFPVMFLDSPSTTESVSYKFQWRTGAATLYLNRRGVSAEFGSTSTITLMEVAG